MRAKGASLTRAWRERTLLAPRHPSHPEQGAECCQSRTCRGSDQRRPHLWLDGASGLLHGPGLLHRLLGGPGVLRGLLRIGVVARRCLVRHRLLHRLGVHWLRILGSLDRLVVHRRRVLRVVRRRRLVLLSRGRSRVGDGVDAILVKGKIVDGKFRDDKFGGQTWWGM